MLFEHWLARAEVLIVEDDSGLATLMRHLLRREGIVQVHVHACPVQAVARTREGLPDLVVLDLHLGHVSGLAVAETLRSELAADVVLPIVMVTGDVTDAAKHRALVLGIDDFLTKPFDTLEFVHRVRNLLRTRFVYLQLLAERTQLEARLCEKMREAERAQVEVLERLARASDYRDDEISEHTRRVGELAGQTARQLGLAEDQAQLIRRAAQLHDVGKIGIRDDILLHDGPFDPEQFEVMKHHTTIGAHILSGGRSNLLLLAEEIARSHHERWDGTGYPQGLRGNEIPLSARIVAVADVFDALTSDRRYRPGHPRERVLDMIREESGAHFDPEVVAAFLAVVGREPTV